MTKEEITKIIVENNLEVEVYEILHYIIMAELGNVKRNLKDAETDLKLCKKFAKVGELKAINDILEGR